MLTLDLNAKTNALSQYQGFNFDSMVKFNGRHYGLNSSGITRIEGAKDAGEDIGAYFELPKTDLGLHNDKWLRSLYVGYESDGFIALSVLFDKRPRQERTFILEATIEGQQTTHTTGHRKNKGPYFRVRIENIDGADFSVDSIDILPVILHPSRK